MRKRKEADRTTGADKYREAARAFACPTCGAGIGQSCIGANGKGRVSVHQARGDLGRPRVRYENAWASQIEVVGDMHVEGYVTYGIRHKATGQFGYVGQTGHFSKRIRSHASGAYRGSKKRVACGLRDILSAGGTVEFLLLERCENEAQSLVMEAKWVGILATEGHSLTNRWLDHQRIIREVQDLDVL
ncbi:MAG: GIY-YIG nuclease family protein [Sphingobium sp.]|nr:GIY-YIG nuclease family protein [Sphingobium sp.]